MNKCEDCEFFHTLCNPSYRSMQNCDNCLNYRKRFSNNECDLIDEEINIDFRWGEMSYYVFSDNMLNYLEDIEN